MQQKQHHNVHAVYDGVFNTASGIIVDIHNPTPDMITLEDIACGLSKICRFGGQINEFYSVALHSCYVSQIAPPDIRLEALLHDASEAYLGDIIKPLKVILGATYTDIETRFMKVISAKFQLDWDDLQGIKQYDTKMLEIEHEYFQKGNLNSFQKAGLKTPEVASHLYYKDYFIREVRRASYHQ